MNTLQKCSWAPLCLSISKVCKQPWIPPGNINKTTDTAGKPAVIQILNLETNESFTWEGVYKLRKMWNHYSMNQRVGSLKFDLMNSGGSLTPRSIFII